jgi:hypothetical protein
MTGQSWLPCRGVSWLVPGTDGANESEDLVRKPPQCCVCPAQQPGPRGPEGGPGSSPSAIQSAEDLDSIPTPAALLHPSPEL